MSMAIPAGAAGAGPPPPPAPKGRERRARPRRHDPQTRAALVLATPFTLLLTFTVCPVVQSLLISFTDTRATDLHAPLAVNLVGLDQYARALSDPVFRRAAANTAAFVCVGVPLTIAAGLAAAVALDGGVDRFRSAFRLGFYLPVVTSIVAVAVVWRFLLQPDSGVINSLLAMVGIDGPNWLADTRTAMPSLMVMAVWRNFGTAMIVFLAGLQGVPPGVREAAAIDGASPWQRFRWVTLPLLRPTLLFVSVTTAVGYLQFFEEPFVMTRGGPLDATVSLSMHTYRQFGYGDYGLAAAMGYLVFVVIAAVSAIQFRLLRENR